jgi:hypothetical protein
MSNVQMIYDNSYKPGHVEFIDRCTARHAGLSDNFVPSAVEFALTNCDYLVCLAHPMGQLGVSRLVWSWNRSSGDGVYDALSLDGYFLYMRPFGSRKKIYSIERKPRYLTGNMEALALNSKPILCTDVQRGKWLVQLCIPNPREEAQCLRWIPVVAPHSEKIETGLATLG